MATATPPTMAPGTATTRPPTPIQGTATATTRPPTMHQPPTGLTHTGAPTIGGLTTARSITGGRMCGPSTIGGLTTARPIIGAPTGGNPARPLIGTGTGAQARAPLGDVTIWQADHRLPALLDARGFGGFDAPLLPLAMVQTSGVTPDADPSYPRLLTRTQRGSQNA